MIYENITDYATKKLNQFNYNLEIRFVRKEILSINIGNKISQELLNYKYELLEKLPAIINCGNLQLQDNSQFEEEFSEEGLVYCVWVNDIGDIIIPSNNQVLLTKPGNSITNKELCVKAHLT